VEKSHLTPIDLARRVNRSGMRVRTLLRDRYPRLAPGSGGRWLLTDEMVADVLAYFAGTEQPSATKSSSDDAAAERLAGDSSEQRAAERAMLELLGQELGVSLAKDRLVSANGAWAEVDGVSRTPPILVEAWAHQGPPKAAQKMKVLNDALKLVWVSSTLPQVARKILLFSDGAAAKHFLPSGSTWAGAALDHFGIEIRVVALPDEMRVAVRRAQERQFR
jgi:hypothetical protein